MEERRKSCWISGAITVKGNVTSAGDLVIDGRVEGAIEIGNHNLTIGETATVVADLMAGQGVEMLTRSRADLERTNQPDFAS